MQREIRLTADGSHTVAIPAMDVSYHSKHGAVSESMQVYIEAGLLTCMNGFASDPNEQLKVVYEKLVTRSMFGIINAARNSA